MKERDASIKALEKYRSSKGGDYKEFDGKECSEPPKLHSKNRMSA